MRTRIVAGVRLTAPNGSGVIDLRRCWCEQASRTITTRESRNGSEVLEWRFCWVPMALPAAISVIAVEGPVTGLVFERAIDTIGHRAHLVPQSGFENVATPHHNLLGQEGSGLALTAA